MLPFTSWAWDERDSTILFRMTFASSTSPILINSKLLLKRVKKKIFVFFSAFVCTRLVYSFMALSASPLAERAFAKFSFISAINSSSPEISAPLRASRKEWIAFSTFPSSKNNWPAELWTMILSTGISLTFFIFSSNTEYSLSAFSLSPRVWFVAATAQVVSRTDLCFPSYTNFFLIRASFRYGSAFFCSFLVARRHPILCIVSLIMASLLGRVLTNFSFPSNAFNAVSTLSNFSCVAA
mmetsp:Transcript_17200/g.36273  ORF Transcript_17200/g.36273 Transcript_17200/m.36273 type:complete len:239 (+) Transcript_17200:1808-2524(+)